MFDVSKRNKYIQAAKSQMGGFVKPSPSQIESWLSRNFEIKIANEEQIRINNPDEVHYAVIPADGQFDPDKHIYKAEKAGVPESKQAPNLTKEHKENMQKAFKFYENIIPRGNQVEINNPQGTIEIKIGKGTLNIKEDTVHGGYVLINLARPNQPINLKDGAEIAIGNPPNDFVVSRVGNKIIIKNNFADSALKYQAL